MSANFSYDEEELKKYNKWMKKHNKKCPLYGNDGAIGGRITYSFTPTSLGLIKKIECGCGEKLDLTDYDW